MADKFSNHSLVIVIIKSFEFNFAPVMFINPRRVCFHFYPLLIIIAIVSVILVGCSGNEKSKARKPNPLFSNGVNSEGKSVFPPLEVGLQTIELDSVNVDIQVPDGKINGDILVLPGWNFGRDRWCAGSDLCSKALAKGYRLIMPEMGLSVYSTHYFPQTRDDWRNAPTGIWLSDTLIPYVQRFFGLLIPGKRNFIVGLSTGGRGVVMTSLRTVNLFKAGASLSGDFDQSQTPYDAVMTGFYGSFDENRDLWMNFDNPMHEAAFLKVPMYLGHGLNDPIVPVEQTQSFYKTLTEVNPKLNVVLHLVPEAGHDFYYWNSEVDAVLNFFEEH